MLAALYKVQRSFTPFVEQGLFMCCFGVLALWGTATPIAPQPKPPLIKKPAGRSYILQPLEDKKDITYCAEQKLDLYQPQKVMYIRSPVVVYIHGGGWEQNNRQSEPDKLELLDGLRQKGFAVASIDYSLLPTAHFPTQVEETLCAIRYLRAHALEHRLDTTRIALLGFSSGGYLAAMAGALDSNTDFNNGQYGQESSRVHAVMGIGGIYDLQESLRPATQGRISRLLQDTDPTKAQPATYLTADDPPFLLLRGDQDQFILPGQDEGFAVQLQDKKIPHTHLVIPNAEHGLNPIVQTTSLPRTVAIEAIEKFTMQTLYNRE